MAKLMHRPTQKFRRNNAGTVPIGSGTYFTGANGNCFTPETWPSLFQPAPVATPATNLGGTSATDTGRIQPILWYDEMARAQNLGNAITISWTDLVSTVHSVAARSPAIRFGQANTCLRPPRCVIVSPYIGPGSGSSMGSVAAYQLITTEATWLDDHHVYVGQVNDSIPQSSYQHFLVNGLPWCGAELLVQEIFPELLTVGGGGSLSTTTRKVVDPTLFTGGDVLIVTALNVGDNFNYRTPFFGNEFTDISGVHHDHTITSENRLTTLIAADLATTASVAARCSSFKHIILFRTFTDASFNNNQGVSNYGTLKSFLNSLAGQAEYDLTIMEINSIGAAPGTGTDRVTTTEAATFASAQFIPAVKAFFGG